MSTRTFIDTNVLVYAFDAGEPEKRAVAASVISHTPNRVISSQVMQEFYVTVTRRITPAMPPREAREVLNALIGLNVQVIDPPMVLSAAALAEAHTLSFWDALIVMSARHAGCTRILSEDMAHGARVAGVLIENPFAELVAN